MPRKTAARDAPPDDLEQTEDSEDVELGDEEIDEEALSDDDDTDVVADLDDDDEEDVVVDEDDEDDEDDEGETVVASEGDEEEEEDEEEGDEVEASLDVILKERLVQVDEEEEEDDEPNDPEDRAAPEAVKVLPKQPQEFVCQSCFLVKHPSQMADAKRQLCRDCV